MRPITCARFVPRLLAVIGGLGCGAAEDPDGVFIESEETSSVSASLPTRLAILAPAYWTGGKCVGIDLSLMDAQDLRAPSASNIEVRLTLGGPKSATGAFDADRSFLDGNFYEDFLCKKRISPPSTSSTGVVVVLPAGSTSKAVFLQDNLAGPLTITATILTATAPAIASPGPWSIRIDPVVAEATFDLSVGWDRACAVVLGARGAPSVPSWGGVYCWGRASSSARWNALPRQLPGFGMHIRKVAVGQAHVCALDDFGGVKCTGNNSYGQLGRPGSSSKGPEQVIGLTAGVVEIQSGLHHSCARMSTGGVKCWGRNTYGQLGNGTTSNSSVPVDVVGLAGATSISAGSLHTCAVASGQVYCWGANALGQLGNGSAANSGTPARVSVSVSAMSVLAGAGNHSCAVLFDGTMQCWGSNTYGELGTTQFLGSLSRVPVFVQGASGVTQASAGAGFTCWAAGGAAYCVGKNGSGQLGNGGFGATSTPLNPAFPVGVSNVSAGGSSACALSQGSPRCWGDGTTGLLGNGTLAVSATAVRVSGL